MLSHSQYNYLICFEVDRSGSIRIGGSSITVACMKNWLHISYNDVVNEDLGLFGKDIFAKYFELRAKDREQLSATEMLTLSSLLQCFTDIKIELTSKSKLSLDTSQIIFVPPPLADWNIHMLHALFLETGWITHEEDQSKLILVPWIEAHINALRLSGRNEEYFQREGKYMLLYMHLTKEKDKIIYTSICFQMQCAKELIAVSRKLASSDFLLVPSVLSSRSVCLPIMNDVLPNAIKRTIANFRNEYIIQHGVNTEDEQPESEVSKAIAKLADLLHGTRKKHFSSRKVGAILQYSYFNEYQLQGLENSQANHFYMKVSHDARVQQRARAVCDFLRVSLDEYVTISNAPDGVRSVILSHANNELEWSLHSFCIEQALLQAKIIEPEEKFTYVQCEEGALQRPVKMTQIANAVLSPVIQEDAEEEELDEFAFTNDQEAKGISLPLNSFYLQATIGKRQIDFMLNKVINVPLVKLFTVQEKTIEIDDIMDTTFVAMWNYYQLLESNGHLDALSAFCEEHKDIILSLSHYECFSTNMPNLFNAWFRDNNDILSNEELDAYQSISIDKECTCTLNISCRMLLEAGLKPAISGIAETIVGTILSNDHFGLYQVAALFVKKSVDFIDVSFERFLEEKLAKLFQSRQRRPTMLFINEERGHLMGQYLVRGSYTQVSDSNYAVKLSFRTDRNSFYCGVLDNHLGAYTDIPGRCMAWKGNSDGQIESYLFESRCTILKKGEDLSSIGVGKSFFLPKCDNPMIVCDISSSFEDDTFQIEASQMDFFCEDVCFYTTINILPVHHSATLKIAVSGITISNKGVAFDEYKSVDIHERLVLKRS